MGKFEEVFGEQPDESDKPPMLRVTPFEEGVKDELPANAKIGSPAHEAWRIRKIIAMRMQARRNGFKGGTGI